MPLLGLTWASYFWLSPGKVMPRAGRAPAASSSLPSNSCTIGCDGELVRTPLCTHMPVCIPLFLCLCTKLDSPVAALAPGRVGLPKTTTRERTGQGVGSQGPDAVFSAKTVPWLGCFVQMAGFLGGSLVKMSAPNRLRDKTDEHFGLTPDPVESWTDICNGRTTLC